MITDQSSDPSSGAVRRATWKQDLGTVLFGTWLIGGLFLDGWAHNNLTNLETFLTPWHAVLYSGFIATAVWVTRTSQWHRPPQDAPPQGSRPQDPLAQNAVFRDTGWRNVAQGYDLALIGVVMFGVGGVADGIWHTLLGIEVSVPALLSPPHFVLLTGALLILTAPLRSAWMSNEPAGQRSLTHFLPPLLSIILVSAAMSFFFQYASAFLDDRPTDIFHRYMLFHHPGDGDYKETNDSLGVLSILVSNVILTGPLLFLLRRWRPAFGSATLLFFSVGAATAAIKTFDQWTTLIAALVGGLVADLVIRHAPPHPNRPSSYRLVAVLPPLAMWGAHFFLLAIFKSVWWPPTLWGGTTVMAALTSLAMSFLIAPPRVPEHAWNQ